MNWSVTANGQPVPIHTTTVLPAPYHHTAQAEFITLILTGETELLLHSARPLTAAVTRPLSRGLTPELLDGHTLRLRLTEPCNLSVEPEGQPEDSLCVFASPERGRRVTPGGDRVYYYAPGEHDIDKTVITGDGVTVYLAPGARLFGKFEFRGCRDLLVCGTGTVECGRYTDVRHRVCLDLVGVQRARVEDICVLDSTFWCVRLFGCRDVVLDGVRILGWRGNTDGVDVVSCRRVLVENVFCRVWDDALVVKAVDETDRNNIHINFRGTDSDFSAGFAGAGDVEDVTFRRCVLWNDFARPMEIGVSLRADGVRGLRYQDIDVIRSTTGYPIMGIHHGDRARVEDVVFDDIRVEDAPGAQLFDLRMAASVWSTDTRRGSIRDVTFRNIRLVGRPGLPVLPCPSRLEGLDAAHDIRGVHFENVCLLGKYPRTPEELGLDIRDFASEVTVTAPADAPEMALARAKLTVGEAFSFRDGRYVGSLRLTLTGERGLSRGTAAVRCAPGHLAETAAIPFQLSPEERLQRELPLSLQPGKYLFSAEGDTAELRGDWLLLELPGVAAGFWAEFVNWNGLRPGRARLSVREGALWVESPLLRDPANTLTVYGAQAAPPEPGEVCFTVEETDLGMAGAVISGPHGPEIAPQLRCPGEITYVFHNQPKVGPIAAVTLPGGGDGTARIPLAELGVRDGVLLAEVALSSPACAGFRYPMTLFHSVIPGESAHMFCRIPAED